MHEPQGVHFFQRRQQPPRQPEPVPAVQKRVRQPMPVPRHRHLLPLVPVRPGVPRLQLRPFQAEIGDAPVFLYMMQPLALQLVEQREFPAGPIAEVHPQHLAL